MIARDLQAAAAQTYDVLVVGGGIYGASVLRCAARKGLRAALLEKGDFGSATSGNSLRIVHGGLRYLQSLDLGRFRQSVVARRSVARRFGRLLRPLPCLMPLYGDGLKRNSVMRVAFAANDLLSAGRNAGVAERVHIPESAVIDRDTTVRLFPAVRPPGLRGAAIWTDYFMCSSERLLIETLREACRFGAHAFNYVQAEGLDIRGGRTVGVNARDVIDGSAYLLRARAVVNCTGGDAAHLAREWSPDRTGFDPPSLAFNVLLDAHLPGGHALAVSAPRPGAPVLFLLPQAHGVLAGTWHVARPAATSKAEPTEAEVADFVADIRAAIPGFDVGVQHVGRVFAGLLPARRVASTELASRPVIADHGAAGGIAGLFSVSGVKFTTAPIVAERAVREIMASCGWNARAAAEDENEVEYAAATDVLLDAAALWSLPAQRLTALLVQLVREEAVHCLDDLILRRANWRTTEPDLAKIRGRVSELLGSAHDWRPAVSDESTLERIGGS